MASGIVDLRQEHQELYSSGEKTRILDAGRTWCITLTGRGDPAGAEFLNGTETLLALVRRLRRTGRKERHDFKLMPLECITWSARRGHDLDSLSPKNWHWRQFIRLPPFVKSQDLALARAELLDRRLAEFARAARLEWVEEGLCAQALHVGPRSAEGETVQRLRSVAESQGLALGGPHHEIYLSDPQRTAPDRMRTLIRRPVTTRRGGRPSPSALTR